MNIISKLTDDSISIESKEVNIYNLRLASRGIIERDDGKIAIQNKKTKNIFKLIGGGIELDENKIQAFQREVKEETGCEVEITEQLGTIEEYRSLNGLKQISYVFVARVINSTNKLNLTEQEKKDSAILLWVEPEEALKLIKDSYKDLSSLDFDDEYNNKFIILRDIKILEYYLNMNKRKK